MYEYKVLEVIKVYDGDTCTLKLDLGFDIHLIQTIRLFGINAPELRELTYEEGKKSRDFLLEALKSAENIIIKTFKDKKEKYGRMLGEIFIDGSLISINKRMVLEGFAIEYFI